MKKILLLAVAALMAVSVNAQLAVKSAAGKLQGKTVVTAKNATKAPRFEAVGAKNIALNTIYDFGKCVAPKKEVQNIKALPSMVNGKKLEVNKDIVAAARAARGIRKAPPANMAALYKGNGQTYSGGAWSALPEWDAIPGEYTDEYGTWDCITEAIPSKNIVFSTETEQDCVYEPGKVYIICMAYAQYDQTHLIYPMDITDFRNGGSGDIELNLAADGTLSIPAANANHVYGWAACTFNEEDYAPISFYGAFGQFAGITYTAEFVEDNFTATASYTGKAKMRGDSKNTTWTMQIGTIATEEGDFDVIRNLVDPSAINARVMDVEAYVNGSVITIEPQLVSVVNDTYYLFISSLNNTTDGNIVLTKDANGYISLPEGESIIIGAYTSEDFDPTRQSANYLGYWEIFDKVKYYAEGQAIPSPAPEIIADATAHGQLFLGLSPTGYSYNANIGILPAYADVVVENYTSDEATAWAWNADKVQYNTSTEENDVVESYTSTDMNFTFPTTSGEYMNINVIGWNNEEESDPYYIGYGKAKENAAFYAGASQEEFEMSDGSLPVVTANNPDNTLKFYTNWATPDLYPDGSVATIFSYGFVPSQPLYIEGIELPFVGFELHDAEAFNLTVKICKATRTGNNLEVGDVIAQCEVNAEDIDDSNAEESGLTMVYANHFSVLDEDEMEEEIDHLFLDEEFVVVIEGFDNGTFTGVLGSQEDDTSCPTTTWFYSTGANRMRSYSGGWPTLFIGYTGAAYGYLNTVDETNLNFTSEGGEATIHVNPMLCSVDEEGNRTTRLFIEGEIEEWVSVESENETYNEDEYGFDLKITVEPTEEARATTVRLWQEGALLELNISQDATGISTVTKKVVKGGKTYNLAGQEVNKNFRGIAVSKGQKFLNK